MDQIQKNTILISAKEWFRDSIATNHKKNSEKLSDPKEFNINPFLVNYLANFLTGDNSPESIAKALVYPRVLGTSITTSFGTNMQRFASEVLEGFGSMISGIDIEFEDQVDGKRKYCQLKAGPNTINKDDVETISGHFTAAKNLARTNNLAIGYNDLIVGVLYGTNAELNSHYKRLVSQYSHPVIVGQDFWHRLTGDSGFYSDLINTMASVANEIDGRETIQNLVNSLANSDEIQNLSS
jgi:hypothetical protein